jgi:hypothetical protein
MVDGAYSLIETKKPDTNSEDFTDIIGDQNYKFRVLAEDSVTGRSAWSIEHQYNSPIGKPSQVQDLNPKLTSTNSITVKWEAPAYLGGGTISGYTLEWRKAGDQNGSWEQLELQMVSSRRIDNLEEDSTYQIRIAAKTTKASAGDFTGDFTAHIQVTTDAKESSSGEDEGLSGAVVAVIVVSAILLVLAIAMVAWLAYVKKDKEASYQRKVTKKREERAKPYQNSEQQTDRPLNTAASNAAVNNNVEEMEFADRNEKKDLEVQNKNAETLAPPENKVAETPGPVLIDSNNVNAPQQMAQPTRSFVPMKQAQSGLRSQQTQKKEVLDDDAPEDSSKDVN